MSSETENEFISSRERSLANLKPFKPGQSGNPKGRPKKLITAEDKAKDSAEAAMAVIVKLMKSDDEKVALVAAREVLDRAMGKPKQTINQSVTKRTLDELSTEDLIAELQSQRDSSGTPTPEAGDGEPDCVH